MNRSVSIPEVDEVMIIDNKLQLIAYKHMCLCITLIKRTHANHSRKVHCTKRNMKHLVQNISSSISVVGSSIFIVK